MLWKNYYRPMTVSELVHLLHEHQSHARLVAGGTDVLVELRRGIRPVDTLIDVTGVQDQRLQGVQQLSQQHRPGRHGCHLLRG